MEASGIECCRESTIGKKRIKNLSKKLWVEKNCFRITTIGYCEYCEHSPCKDFEKRMTDSTGQNGLDSTMLVDEIY
jgi:hypothetical protein